MIIDVLVAALHAAAAMLRLLGVLFRSLASALRSRTALVLDNLALRQQLACLTATRASRPKSSPP